MTNATPNPELDALVESITEALEDMGDHAIPDFIMQAAALASAQVLMAYKNGEQPMKDATEVQHAHDIITGFLLGEVRARLSGNDWAALHSAADTLCWVLNHQHNQSFNDNLARLEHIAAAQGYQLVQHHRPPEK